MEDRSATMKCPCGCRQRIEVAALLQAKLQVVPARRRRARSAHAASSVWLKEGCRSHFLLKVGKVVWVGARPEFPLFRTRRRVKTRRDWEHGWSGGPMYTLHDRFRLDECEPAPDAPSLAPRSPKDPPTDPRTRPRWRLQRGALYSADSNADVGAPAPEG